MHKINFAREPDENHNAIKSLVDDLIQIEKLGGYGSVIHMGKKLQMSEETAIKNMIKSLERIGVSAVVIEDKIGTKKNSLFKDQTGVKQDSIKNFCKKIIKAKESKISDDFLIIARIESFILGKNINDAIKRAESYSRAGADAILIHSKEKTCYQHDDKNNH